MRFDRRRFHRLALGSAVAGLAAPLLESFAAPGSPADISLRIEDTRLEIGKGVVVPTTAYNGQVPGPLLRLRRGRPYTIDVTNRSQREDLVHWHGLRTDPLNDGAVE